MATQIIIRNLDESVVARLAAKAQAAGQSLQAYMATLATAAAETMSTSEMVDRARTRVDERTTPGPTRGDILAALSAPR